MKCVTQEEPIRTVDNVYEAVRNEANNNNNNNETRRNIDDNGQTIGGGTRIQNFYAGQSVFITGGTGFLGKVLIEKLLRSCPDLSTIYLLIRRKKDKNVEDRIETIFNDPLYDRLRKEVPKFRHKIVAMSGDCSVRGLGLSSDDRERLIQEVSIVFHSAATVRFDEKIDIAMAINVDSISDMIDLCKRMERLKAFIHVSTAYANCHVPKIEEKFYHHPFTYETVKEMISELNDDNVKQITKKILGQWPNTYAFTKALAEDVVKEKGRGLNMGIFRPAMVISCAHEPIPGWIDNMYGPTGAVAGVTSGVLKTMHCNTAAKANVVPADYTVNALITSAWDVANQPNRRNENMLIYNYVANVESDLTWADYRSINLRYGKEFPPLEIKWTMSLALENYKFVYIMRKIFSHYIPGLLGDFFLICMGRKPILMTMYRKIDKFLHVVTWFCIRDWIFTNDNVQSMWKRLGAKDQQNFRFSIKQLDWQKYFRNYMKGVRIYLMKDDLSTLEASRKRFKRLQVMHETLKLVLLSIILWIFWKLLSAIIFR